MRSKAWMLFMLPLIQICQEVVGDGLGLVRIEDTTMTTTVAACPSTVEVQSCRLDLSEELFGGVEDACGPRLDRRQCCPVLAAWLFAAHARSALEVHAPAASDLPLKPDDSQKCVESLQRSLLKRNIRLAQPNDTCDAVICACGIRLHQISSLSCPAAFNLSANGTVVPTAAVTDLEKHCKNASYAGCSVCLKSLQKVKAGTTRGRHDDRASEMFSRDCQLMGLTWLLARNKTAYIPTVSAVLRAIMYSSHPWNRSNCSADEDNMPLAVNSLQFQTGTDASTATATASSPSIRPFLSLLAFLVVVVFHHCCFT